MTDYLLELRDVHTYSGLAYILRGVSLALKSGETVALLGRNGEGKTPTIRTIMSIIPPQRGDIYFQGERISGTPTHVVARKGIAVVPKGRRIFPALNVVEHLRMPVCDHNLKRDDMLKQVFEIFPELVGKKSDPVRSLSGGQQQMLVIGRALMMRPKLLLMDEPMEGLAPVAVRRVMESMRTVQALGVAILLASANCEMAMAVAERAYVIQKGKIVYSGSKAELTATPEIRQKYLGVRE
jgi:branched-chain amino acid transport system ATP-binding protein